MASASRDRITIDLRGIGDAVRAASAGQGMGVAQLVRRSVVASLDSWTPAQATSGSDGQTPGDAVAKLTLRLPRLHADALILNAGTLGLSYGEYVARLIDGTPLPQPVVERRADRAALLASNDQLAALSADLNALVSLLRRTDVAQVRAYRERLELTETEILRHLDRASALIAGL